jgi:hypothetical protein
MAPTRLLRPKKRPTTERPTIEAKKRSTVEPKKRCTNKPKRVLAKQLPTIAYLEYLGFDAEDIVRPRTTNGGGESQFKCYGPGRCADLTSRIAVKELLLDAGLPWFHPKIDGLTLDKIARGETVVPEVARPQDGEAPPAKGCISELIDDDETVDSNGETGDNVEEGSGVQEEGSDVQEEGSDVQEEGSDVQEEGSDGEEAVGELGHLRAKYGKRKAEVKELQEKLQAEQERCRDLKEELVQVTDDYDFCYYHLQRLGSWSANLEEKYIALEKEYKTMEQMVEEEIRMKRNLVN